MAKRRRPTGGGAGGGGFDDDLPSGISGRDVREIDTEFYDVPANFPRVFIRGRYEPFRNERGRIIKPDDRWQKWETETPYGYGTLWYADIAFYRIRATTPYLTRTFMISWGGVQRREDMEAMLDDWIIEALKLYLDLGSPDSPESRPKEFAEVFRVYAHTDPMGWHRAGWQEKK